MRSYSAHIIKARIKSLKARHIATSERSRTNPDQFVLQDMKRRRLKLKDEIAGYSFI